MLSQQQHFLLFLFSNLLNSSLSSQGLFPYVHSFPGPLKWGQALAAGLYLALSTFLWKAHVKYEGLAFSTLPALLEGARTHPVLVECESCQAALDSVWVYQSDWGSNIVIVIY